MSQAVNDWYDRHVDAINEPNRPIPSGRMPGRWGLYIAILWSVLSLIVAALIGPVVFWAAAFGVAMPPGPIQRTALAAEAEWLVGQCGGGALL
jgi:chlorophyll/bacteriochlorophyll a synthase